MLPAMSRQLPPMLTPAPSGPPYVPDVHDSTPDVGSWPIKLKATGLLNQPL